MWNEAWCRMSWKERESSLVGGLVDCVLLVINPIWEGSDVDLYPISIPSEYEPFRTKASSFSYRIELLLVRYEIDSPRKYPHGLRFLDSLSLSLCLFTVCFVCSASPVSMSHSLRFDCPFKAHKERTSLSSHDSQCFVRSIHLFPFDLERDEKVSPWNVQPDSWYLLDGNHVVRSSSITLTDSFSISILGSVSESKLDGVPRPRLCNRRSTTSDRSFHHCKQGSDARKQEKDLTYGWDTLGYRNWHRNASRSTNKPSLFWTSFYSASIPDPKRNARKDRHAS